MNPRKHYEQISRVLIVILLLNWAVALAKLIYGIFSRCSSMTADGFHSLSDGASNIVGLIGIHFACQPKDADHPYGHKKYETFFALAIAMMLFLITAGLIHEGINKLRFRTQPEVGVLNFIIMVITMAINLWVMRYEYKKGLALKSDILVSDSLHTKADLLTSASVIIALIGIKLGFPIVDPIATLIIAIFIAHAGWDIVKESSKVLCDTVSDVESKKIEGVVLKIQGVKNCHKIRSRGRSDDIHVDLHVQVEPDMHMEEAHRISYKIEEALKKQIPEITDVIVHMEPL